MNSGKEGGWSAPIPVNQYIGEDREILAAKQRICQRRLASMEADRDIAIVAGERSLVVVLDLQISGVEMRLRLIEEAL